LREGTRIKVTLPTQREADTFAGQHVWCYPEAYRPNPQLGLDEAAVFLGGKRCPTIPAQNSQDATAAPIRSVRAQRWAC
jgi:hypothetical protein